MGPRILDVAMTDQDYEALRKKLLETYSVRPTLLNPTVKGLVDWHCLESSCFLDNMVFDKREKWMRHHQRFHNRMCESDRGYPKEVEAKQFIQERERRRKNARHGIAGAGGSARLMPPTAATPPGPHSRISGAVRVNSVAPSSSTSGALCGASPNSAAPNSPRSGAPRNSAAAGRRRGPRGPYRVRANKAARPPEHPYQVFVNHAGAQQDAPESFGTLDAAGREILMQKLSRNLQAVSWINADSMHIMQILGLRSTNCGSEIRLPEGGKRPRESPVPGAQGYPATPVATPVPLPTWVDRRAQGSSTSRRPGGFQAGPSKFVDAARQAPAAHFNVARAHVFEAPLRIFEATPYPSQAPAHSNRGPAHVFEAIPHPSQAPAHRSQHPSQVLAIALSVGGPAAHPYEGPPLSIERPAHHPYDALAHLAPTYVTPSQREEEENYNAAADSERVDCRDPDSSHEYIYQADDVSEDDNEGQVQWRDVKIEAHAAGYWP